MKLTPLNSYLAASSAYLRNNGLKEFMTFWYCHHHSAKRSQTTTLMDSLGDRLNET